MSSPSAPVAATQFGVFVDTPNGTQLPAVSLMLHEDRVGGFSGTMRLNPRRSGLEDAVQTVLADGLTPGGAAVIRLAITGSGGPAGTSARIWPGVVTSVHATGPAEPDEPYPLCAVTIRDPLTYLRGRPVWAAFADCPLADMLGGVLSATAGGDGQPTRNPVLAGLPMIRIGEELRDDLDRIPYAISPGEPLGDWLNRLWGRLGVRCEMQGDPGGGLDIWLRDAGPSTTKLNSDGGVQMTFDPAKAPSANNLVVGSMEVHAQTPGRGALLDNLAAGGARRFGVPGSVETVHNEAELQLDEARRRAGFAAANRRLAHAGITVTTRQPGLLPGRIVRLDGAAETPRDDREQASAAYGSILGAARWQVAAVGHLCVQSGYWNQTSLEKTGVGWRPAQPPDPGAAIVSAIVDDGASEDGELVARDRMGRIPVRFPFVHDATGDDADGTNGDTDGATPGNAGAAPPIPLAPVPPGAGNRHGFMMDHRQGDWCRVAVVNPLYAEIVGFRYRDDRHLGDGLRDASAGIVMREGGDEWRGMVFRPEDKDSG